MDSGLAPYGASRNDDGGCGTDASKARPITAAATLTFPATSRSCIFRPIHRNSIRRKISGMKFAKKYSRTMHSNPWTPCAPSSSRPSSTLHAIQTWSAPSRSFPYIINSLRCRIGNEKSWAPPNNRERPATYFVPPIPSDVMLFRSCAARWLRAGNRSSGYSAGRFCRGACPATHSSMYASRILPIVSGDDHPRRRRQSSGRQANPHGLERIHPILVTF